MANSRILVEEPIFDEFCERFVEAAKSLELRHWRAHEAMNRSIRPVTISALSVGPR